MTNRKLEFIEYSVWNIKNARNFICSFETLTDCRHLFEKTELIGTDRKVKANLTEEDYKKVKLREGVSDFIKTVKSRGLNLSLVTELTLHKLALIHKNSEEVNKLDVFSRFDGNIIAGKPDWCDKSSKVNLFLQSIISNEYYKDESIALTSFVQSIHSAQSAGLNVIAIPTEENQYDSDRISLLVDCYLNFNELTKMLK